MMKHTAASTKILKARTAMVMDSPWFGLLALKLACVECTQARGQQIETMATDGTHLYFNTQFTLGLSDSECLAVVGHEVMHCALQHVFRRGSRDPLQWNIAADYVVNLILSEARDRNGKAMFTLPNDCLLDKRFTGMTTEHVYSIIAQESASGKPKPQFGTGKGSVGADVMDAPGEGEGESDSDGDGKPENGSGKGKGTRALTATDWDIAVAQAEKVGAGTTPGSMKREIEERQHRVDWRDALKRFTSNAFPVDVAWSRPNRRMLGQGIILPGVVKEGCGQLVVAADTSGSISSEMLNQVWAEIKAICEDARPEKVTVLWIDSEVAGVEEFAADDVPPVPTPQGGGGTRFQPAFDYVEKSGVSPACLIYITDMDCYDSPRDPGYPVLWVTARPCYKTQPFGELIQVD